MSNIHVSQILDSLVLNEESTGETNAVRYSQLTSLQSLLETAITAEQNRATTAEGELDSKIATSVANLVNGAPETLDTLNELAQALGNDSNLATTITESIATEKARAEAAELVLTNNLAAEVSRAKAAEDVVAAAVVTERDRAVAAETVLTNNLATEVARAIAAESANADAVVAEKDRAVAAETVLTDNLATEVSRAKSVEDTLLVKNNGSHTGTLSTEDIQVAQTSYLYIGDKWRIQGSNDGTRLNFQYNKAVSGAPADYVVAIPFITAVSSAN
jgi:hypothetical protein